MHVLWNWKYLPCLIETTPTAVKLFNTTFLTIEPANIGIKKLKARKSNLKTY